jgi:hypothetical protein
MDYKGEVNRLLSELAKVLNLSSLALDTNNHCLILFDDKIVLNLELDEQEGALIIYSYVSVVPFVAKELILEILLEANFFWKVSNGATFSIDKQTQTLILQKKIFLPLRESGRFEDDLALFMDVVDAWMKRIDEICTEAEVLADKDLETASAPKQYGSWKH